MPVEIKELIIEASLLKSEDRGPDPTKLLTDEDETRIIDKVFDKVRSQGGMTPGERKELIADVKREMRTLLEELWRK